jgi:hypothetical protein
MAMMGIEGVYVAYRFVVALVRFATELGIDSKSVWCHKAGLQARSGASIALIDAARDMLIKEGSTVVCRAQRRLRMSRLAQLTSCRHEQSSTKQYARTHID